MTQTRFCPWCGNRLGTREIEGKQYAACETGGCGYVFWDNPVTVVAAIVEHEGAVILARGKGWPAGMFGLVTGFLERGESPEEAVVREVKEELGLNAALRELVGIYPFFQKNQLILAYDLIAEGEITLNDELEEIRRVSPDKLKAWSFGTGLAVQGWLDKRKAEG